MWVCIYVRVDTHSFHAGVYIFTYIHTEITCGGEYCQYRHAESTCIYVHICIYAHRVNMWVCMYLRVHTHIFYMCAYMDLRICTQRLHVCVYVGTYITQSLHVDVCIFAYMHTEFTCICVHIDV